MTRDQAMRCAIAAGEQVAENNPELASAQRRAWARFIRIVWAGGPAVRPDEATKAGEQFSGETGVRLFRNGKASSVGREA